MSFPNEQDNPEAAIPVWIAPQPSGGGGGLEITGDTVEIDPDTADEVLAARPGRRYLFIQPVTEDGEIWANWIGGTAAPGATGSARIAWGQSYESGLVCPNAAVSIYSLAGCDVTVMEG